MNFATHTENSAKMDQMMIDLECDYDVKVEVIEALCQAPIHFAQMSNKMKRALSVSGVRGIFAV